MLIVHHFVLMIVIVPSMLCAFQQYSWKTGTNFILSEYLQTYVYIYIQGGGHGVLRGRGAAGHPRPVRLTLSTSCWYEASFLSVFQA